jgi:hypothetical protein
MTVKIITSPVSYNIVEVSDPSMSVLAEGFKKDGPKPYILNKIVNTSLRSKKNNIFIHGVAMHNLQVDIRRLFHSRMRAASRIGPHNQDAQITLDPN